MKDSLFQRAINYWSKLTIYKKGLVLYVLCLTPVVLFGGFVVESNAGQARKQVMLGALQTVDLAAANAENFLQAALIQVEMLAVSPTVVQSDRQQLKNFFLSYLGLDTYLDDILLIDDTGGIIAQGYTLDRERPPDEESEILRWIALQSKPEILHINDWFAGRQRPILITYPITHNDQKTTLIGVVAAWRLYQALNMKSNVQGAEILLTDQTGDVIAHPSLMFTPEIMNVLDLPPVEAALAGVRGTQEYYDPLRESTRLAAFTTVPGAGWAAVVSYPESVVVPVSQQILIRGLIILLFLVLGAGYLATIVGRHIVEPLEALTEGVEAIANGDFKRRVVPRDSDEIGRLSEGFNRMASSLEHMAQGLLQANQEITSKAEQLTQLLRRSIDIQEEERRRIALDLHDGPLQVLVGTVSGIHSLRVRSGKESELSKELGYIEELLQGLVAEVRDVVYDLRPPLLETAGLMAALKQSALEFQRNFGLACHVVTIGSPTRLPRELELGLFRAFQESLQNVAKHAQASNVTVTVAFQDEGIEVRVVDDGRGFSADSIANGAGLGLLSMRERIESIGGELIIESEEGEGTRLTMSVPLEPTAISWGEL